MIFSAYLFKSSLDAQWGRKSKKGKQIRKQKLTCGLCKLACFNESLHPNSWNNHKVPPPPPRSRVINERSELLIKFSWSVVKREDRQWAPSRLFPLNWIWRTALTALNLLSNQASHWARANARDTHRTHRHFMCIYTQILRSTPTHANMKKKEDIGVHIHTLTLHQTEIKS